MNKTSLTLTELKSFELDILSYIDQVCRDNDITYYLAFGSALGAVRHQGFIPWDDDIDILMMRDQYEKLENVLSTIDGGRYVFKSLKTDRDYSIPYAKVIDTHTLLIRDKYRKCIELGAYIDVFILDYLPSGDAKVSLQNKVCQKLNVLWEISQLNDCGGSNPVTKLIQMMIRIIPPRQYALLLNKVASRFNHRYHSNMVNMQHFFLRPRLASDFDEIYGNGAEVTFEGRHFNAPKNIDAYLTRTYGDYMQYPPVEEQVPKHPNHVVMRSDFLKNQEKRRIAVVLAGGTGSRIGSDIPKQFIKVQGKPILAYTLEAFQNNALINTIEIVCHKDWSEEVRSICEVYRITKMKWLCTGGTTFQESTMNGINNLKGIVASDDIVVVSFGVSPMTSQEEIDDCIRVCEEHGNAVSAAQMDLLLGVTTNNESTEQSIARDDVRGFANPWAFRYGELLQVYEEVEKRNILSSVEPHITSLFLSLGKRLWFSKHNRQNIKITYKEDLETFEGYLLLQKQRLKEKYESVRNAKEDNRMVSFKEFELLKRIRKSEEYINMHNMCNMPKISGGGVQIHLLP